MRCTVRSSAADARATIASFAADVAEARSLAARRTSPRTHGANSCWTIPGVETLGYVEAELTAGRDSLRFRAPDAAASDPDLLFVGPAKADRWPAFDHEHPEGSLDAALARWSGWAEAAATTDPAAADEYDGRAVDLLRRYARATYGGEPRSVMVHAPTAHARAGVSHLSEAPFDLPELGRILDACDGMADPVVRIARVAASASATTSWTVQGPERQFVVLEGRGDPLEAVRILSSVPRR